MDKYAVIMAGGVGSRLWPLSREAKPKQFISADDDKCMLIQTIERICEVVPAEKCFIITNKNLHDITLDTIKGFLPSSNIILEPTRKNTATCIAYASVFLKHKIGSGILSFIPADGYVKDNTNYRKALENAYLAAEITNNIVTIGINPTYPATEYGYIHADFSTCNENFTHVINFYEKPELENAKLYLDSGEYLWNSGIVLGDMNVIIDNIKRYLPDHFNKLSEAIVHLDNQDYDVIIEKAYEEVQNISFDKGVLENSKQIYTVKGFFDWDDIGSLDSFSKTLSKDSSGNSIRGKHFGLETSDSVIYSDDVLIATIGINNMIIASTKDAIIICPRDRAQEIKSLVEKLKQNGYEYFI
ncbi:MAG: mannose-phosphate guanylyltransferase [Herbinix sp.]|jgi:mannose-1-phosphate guanylyltransferase|nr:mannose-phosphate guanylyltransferase [Herbinix sp.]